MSDDFTETSDLAPQEGLSERDKKMMEVKPPQGETPQKPQSSESEIPEVDWDKPLPFDQLKKMAEDAGVSVDELTASGVEVGDLEEFKKQVQEAVQKKMVSQVAEARTAAEAPEAPIAAAAGGGGEGGGSKKPPAPPEEGEDQSDEEDEIEKLRAEVAQLKEVLEATKSAGVNEQLMAAMQEMTAKMGGLLEQGIAKEKREKDEFDKHQNEVASQVLVADARSQSAEAEARMKGSAEPEIRKMLDDKVITKLTTEAEDAVKAAKDAAEARGGVLSDAESRRIFAEHMTEERARVIKEMVYRDWDAAVQADKARSEAMVHKTRPPEELGEYETLDGTKLKQEEISVTTPYGYKKEIVLPVTVAGKLDWMRRRLAFIESTPDSFGSNENYNYISEIYSAIQYLRGVADQEGKPQQKHEAAVAAQAMKRELESRQALHEYMLIFIRANEAEHLDQASRTLFSRYFKTLFAIKEVQNGFLAYESVARDFISSRGESRQVFQDEIAFKISLANDASKEVMIERVDRDAIRDAENARRTAGLKPITEEELNKLCEEAAKAKPEEEVDWEKVKAEEEERRANLVEISEEELDQRCDAELRRIILAGSAGNITRLQRALGRELTKEEFDTVYRKEMRRLVRDKTEAALENFQAKERVAAEAGDAVEVGKLRAERENKVKSGRWAQNVSERLWKTMGRAAAWDGYDEDSYMNGEPTGAGMRVKPGGEFEFRGEGGGDFVYRRLFRFKEWALGNRKGTPYVKELMKYVDLGAGDVWSKLPDEFEGQLTRVIETRMGEAAEMTDAQLDAALGPALSASLAGKSRDEKRKALGVKAQVEARVLIGELFGSEYKTNNKVFDGKETDNQVGWDQGVRALKDVDFEGIDFSLWNGESFFATFTQFNVANPDKFRSELVSLEGFLRRPTTESFLKACSAMGYRTSGQHSEQMRMLTGMGKVYRNKELVEKMGMMWADRAMIDAMLGVAAKRAGLHLEEAEKVAGEVLGSGWVDNIALLCSYYKVNRGLAMFFLMLLFGALQQGASTK